MEEIQRGTFRPPVHPDDGLPVFQSLPEAPFEAGRAHLAASTFWRRAIELAKVEPAMADFLQATVDDGVDPSYFYDPVTASDMRRLPGFVSLPDRASANPARALFPSIYQTNRPLPEPIPGLMDPTEFMDTEIAAMLAAGAIKETDHRPWVCQPVGCARNGALTKQRLVYDCRALNSLQRHMPLSYPRLRALVRWARRDSSQRFLSLDVKSAYYSLKVKDGWQEAFGFCWRGRYYTYEAMCFGWCEGCYIYQNLMAVFGAAMRVWIHRRATNLHYLDDSGVLVELRHAAAVAYAFTRALALAGMTLSASKSELDGVLELTLLGLELSLPRHAFVIPRAKEERLQAEIADTLARGVVPVKQLQRLCGLLISLMQAVPVALMLARPLFALVADAIQAGCPAVDVSDAGSQQALREMATFPQWAAQHVWPSDTHAHLLAVSSDASDDGQGLVFSDPGTGTRLEFAMPIPAGPARDSNIMVKEADAVVQFLQRHGRLLQDKAVRFLVDNECMRAANQGRGSRHLPLNEVALKTWRLLACLNIAPTWDRITTTDNSRADELSRRHLPPATPPALTAHRMDGRDIRQGVAYALPPPSGYTTPDLAVPMDTIRGIEAWAGRQFTLDMTASPLDARAPRFVGRYDYSRQPHALRDGQEQVFTDALAFVPGPEEFLLVNPPWRMVAPLLRHVMDTGATGVFLCPDAPTELWFSAMLRAAVPGGILAVASRGSVLYERVATPAAALMGDAPEPPVPRLAQDVIAVHFDFRRQLGPRPPATLLPPPRRGLVAEATLLAAAAPAPSGRGAAGPPQSRRRAVTWSVAVQGAPHSTAGPQDDGTGARARGAAVRPRL